MVASRTPQGVRGLKPTGEIATLVKNRRTPQGVRGLKLLVSVLLSGVALSHSARSAWIETM